MSDSPTAWEFSGALPTVPIRPVPVTPDPDVDRTAGYRQYGSDGVGCLPAALATLLGQRAQLVAACLGDNPDVAAATRFVELWSGDLTLQYVDPADVEPRIGKALAIARAPGGGQGRHRGEAGRFVSAPVHAVVVHADDLHLYHDPHATPLPQSVEVLGYLFVVPALAAPAVARFPISGDPS